MSAPMDYTTIETLANERKNPPFDVEAMSVANHGGEYFLNIKKRTQQELERNPAFFNDDIYDLTKEELLSLIHI